MQNTIIGQLEAEQMGKNVPDFSPGDTVVVDVSGDLIVDPEAELRLHMARQ